jgi:hypothetical protein
MPKTNKDITSGASRGIPYAIPEDFALSGDTRNPLHTKALPRRSGAHARTVTSQGLHTDEQTVSLPGKGAPTAGKGQIPDGQRYAYPAGKSARPATDNDE